MSDNACPQNLHEYHKLIATGLRCLQVVLDNTKLAPRLEARVRFRYASILCEETNNVMEAETALTKGITLCERVLLPCPISLCAFGHTLTPSLESIYRPEVYDALSSNKTTIFATESQGGHDRSRWPDTGC